MSIKVSLRKKAISGKKYSLYLDFYPPIPHPQTCKPTRRQFLGKYLYAPIKISKHKHKDGSVKEIPTFDLNPILNGIFEQHNRDTMQVAEKIRQQRDNIINKPEIYSEFEKQQIKIKEQGEKNFVEYFKQLTDKRKGSTHDNWKSTYSSLKLFTGGHLQFAKIDVEFCNDFKKFLLNEKCKNKKNATLSKNTASSYFKNFKSALREAYIEDKLQKDINIKIKSIPEEEPVKNFLSLEELNILAKTDCKNPVLKQAALFFALTGMGYAEMRNLVWGDIHISESGGILIPHRRQKTTRVNYLPISKQAYNLLGEPMAPTSKVFIGLKNSDRYTDFQIWLAKAGIHKHLTFHDLKHTFGNLQIELGTDLYTLQGLFNHKSPNTTAHYGKASNPKKREAAEKIKLNFDIL